MFEEEKEKHKWFDKDDWIRLVSFVIVLTGMILLAVLI
jgi:hypothetical protein